MPVESCAKYDTIVVGAAYLVKGILQRLGFASIVDEALQSQPVIEATYGNLAQIIVANRITFSLSETTFCTTTDVGHYGIGSLTELTLTEKERKIGNQ
jgi:hypothetical protein